MKRFEWFVGLRYLLSKKKKSLLSLTSLISISGVTIGVMALIVVISVMNGFGKDIQDKVLGFRNHITIESESFLPFNRPLTYMKQLSNADSRIESVIPYVQTEMMLKVDGSVSGVLFKGLDTPETQSLGKASSGVPEILLGKELALNLGIRKGDVVNIISPIETTGPLGTIPKMRKYKVAGSLVTGLYEYDTKLVYVPMKEAQDFLEYGNKVDGIELKVSELYKTRDIIKSIAGISQSEGLRIRDWTVLNKNLFSALKLEKFAMFVILSFIILVAALNIVTTITRSVLEKRREISILKTMGARQSQILFIFLLQGVYIGSLGILLGALGGWGLCVLLNTYQIIQLPDIFYFTSVPVDIQVMQFVIICAVALLITGVCSLYPAWRASKLDPLDGIRY